MRRTIKSSLPLLLGNICLLFLLLAGGFFSFVSAYSLPADNLALLAGCIGFSVLFAVLWSVPYGGWGALALLGLDALAVWRWWEWLEPAAAELWTAVSGGEPAVMDLYALRSHVQAAGPASRTAAQLLLVLAFACVLGWLAVRERCWHLPAVLVVLPLISALVSGVLPDLLPLLAETAGWGTLLLTSLYNRKDPASLGKGLWMSLGGISALLLLLLALLPQEGYTRPDWATGARDRLLDGVSQGFAALWNDSGGSGIGWNLDFGISGPSGSEVNGQVDLTETGPRQYAGQTELQVTGGTPGQIYLRGGSSAVYTGSSWTALPDSVYEELPYAPETFPALTAPDGTPSETMTITHVRSGGDNAYVPYRLLDFPDGLAYSVLDSGAERLADSYQVAYIPGAPTEDAFTALSAGVEAWEKRYADFVYSHYLDVPEAARQALAQLPTLNLSVSDVWPSELKERYQERVYIALYTAQILASSAVYDLDVPAMEPDGDFVAHFLEEGRGYCVHFATAGTLLLRMQGIPARYVEGYAPRLRRAGVSNVRDRDAHAWVEIYLDGYGWYPVEMTPGMLQTQTPSDLPEDEPLDEETDEPFEENPEDNQPEIPDNSEGNDTVNTPDQKPVKLDWLWRAAAVLLALAAPYGAYRLALLLRRRRRTHPDTNRSAIYAYLRYQRLLHWGGPEEPELEELGRKAKFSQHQLTEEERTAAWRCSDHAAAEWKKQKLTFKNSK